MSTILASLEHRPHLDIREECTIGAFNMHEGSETGQMGLFDGLFVLAGPRCNHRGQVLLMLGIIPFSRARKFLLPASNIHKVVVKDGSVSAAQPVVTPSLITLESATCKKISKNEFQF